MTRTLLSLAACAALIPAAFAAEPAPKPAPTPATAPAVKPVKVGVVKVDGKTITVSRVGDIVAEKELLLDVALPAGMAAPKSLTVWLAWGDEASGGKSDKVEAKLKDGVYAATVKIPNKTELLKGVAIWLSLEPATGKAILRSVGLPKE